MSAEQKKANHILSEKKRRQAIKDAFDNLMAMVPNRSASGHANSKSMQILKAVEYIRGLKQRTRLLRDAAHKLKTSAVPIKTEKHIVVPSNVDARKNTSTES